MSSDKYLAQLQDLTFDNRYTRDLPADPEQENYVRYVSDVCYSTVQPLNAPAPELVSHSPDAADLLDLSAGICESEEFLQTFCGNKLLPAMNAHATRYGGHQFGSWAGQLGDGRAINLGEVVNRAGERWTLQLKGSGPTPYSRHADGLAVLRSSVREYLCSEAMYYLGVPTTRALSLMTTGSSVLRDMFYDGNAKYEPGAVVCRLAPSFTRFGHFQMHASQHEHELLKRLLDLTICTDFPHLGEPCEQTYIAWFHEVCRLTADMVVHWMRVGFVHGVMNTDNMSILGLTIDYGPYGWLEDFDPSWTPNTTDASGRRYCFGNQPEVALWNLTQLKNALLPLVTNPEALDEALLAYQDCFQQGWRQMMTEKLGFSSFVADTDLKIFNELLALLATVETDMTIFFRKLAEVEPIVFAGETEHRAIPEPLLDAYYDADQLDDYYKQKLFAWLDQYQTRAANDVITPEQRRAKMNAANPKYVLRNYLAQTAIEQAEQGNNSGVHELLELLRNPYDEQPGKERFAQKRPDWAKIKAGCSMLSCSS